MKPYDYKRTGEYSIMVFTDEGANHSHFSCVQMADINSEGERVPMIDPDGTFPKTIFDFKESYQECCEWFAETESHLRSQGHSVHTYTEEGVPIPCKRILVNFPDIAVAYMEANDMIFLTEENEAENIAGELLSELLESDESA